MIPSLFDQNLSQDELIKRHLLRGERISPMTALNLYGCFRLSSRIHELRKDLNIVKEMVQNNGKKYAEYYLAGNQ
jgi:hypothetical protein